jgi:hypothetical protein
MAKKKLEGADFGEFVVPKRTQADKQAERQAPRQAQNAKKIYNKSDTTQASRQALRQAEFKKLINNKSKKVKQTIRIDRHKYIQIKTYCNEKNISFQSVINDLIDVFCKELP